MKIDNEILNRYLSYRCTTEEARLVEAWFDEAQESADVNIEAAHFLTHLHSLDERVTNHVGNPRRFKFTWLMGIAASALLICAFLVKEYMFQNPVKQYDSIADIKAPGSANSVLLLNDQTELSLDSLHIGDTLIADGYQIVKLDNGAIQYVGTRNADQRIFNTIRTKAGGAINLLLSDGSMVWLNANSELRYPIDFKGEMREVFLEGEAYFEVEKSKINTLKSRDFYVRGHAQTIRVLGTKFNADFNDAGRVALLEGRVNISPYATEMGSISDESQEIKLYPNQIYSQGKILSNQNVNRFTDWKDGYFDLENLSLYELAKKLSGWYGVKIEVAPNLGKHELFGIINRSKNLDEVLNLVEQIAPIKAHLENNIVYINQNNSQ